MSAEPADDCWVMQKWRAGDGGRGKGARAG